MGFFESGTARQRMFITSLSDPRTTLTPQFNPTEFQEALTVNYVRQRVPGLSHEPLQYINTTNQRFTMELFFDALGPSGENPLGVSEQAQRNLIARKFLKSVCYPRRPVGDFAIGGPPRLLFVWPHIISLTTVITSLQIQHQRFSATGVPLQFTAAIQLEEIRDMRLIQDDVLENGTIRGSNDDPLSGGQG